MAEPTVPGGPPEIAPPLRGYRKGAHGAVIDAALAVTEAADDNELAAAVKAASGAGASCEW